MNPMSLLRSLENHPIIKQIKIEEAERVLKMRKEVAARIMKARESAEKVLSGLQAKVDAALADLKANWEAREALSIKAYEAGSALNSEQWQIEREIAQGEAELRENCDPCIDEAIRWFRDQWDILRRCSINSEEEFVGWTPLGESRSALSTNYPMIVAALDYCRAMIKELEEMKLVPAVDLERIEAIKKGIPDVDKMIKVDGNIRSNRVHVNRVGHS